MFPAPDLSPIISSVAFFHFISLSLRLSNPPSLSLYVSPSLSHLRKSGACTVKLFSAAILCFSSKLALVTLFVRKVGVYLSGAPCGTPPKGKSHSREPLLKGRLSTVDFFVLTSLDELLLILQELFDFFYKTSYLNEEVNSTEPSPSVSVPWSLSSL